MGNGVGTTRTLPRLALGCGMSSAIIGSAALAGTAIGQPFLMGVRASYVPMAPNTAIGFVVMGLVLCLLAADDRVQPGIRKRGHSHARNLAARRGWRRWATDLAALAALLVAIVCVFRLIEFAAGASFAVDSWFMRVPARKLDEIPVGRMAMSTAFAFLAASLAAPILAWSRRERDLLGRNVAGAGATVGGAIGLIFVLGYLFSPNAPLLYGGHVIPMALNTGIGLVLLGTGLAAAAGPGAFPLQRLCGPSIRAAAAGLPAPGRRHGGHGWLAHPRGGDNRRRLDGSDCLGRTRHGGHLRVRRFPGTDCRPGRRADRARRG